MFRPNSLRINIGRLRKEKAKTQDHLPPLCVEPRKIHATSYPRRNSFLHNYSKIKLNNYVPCTNEDNVVLGL